MIPIVTPEEMAAIDRAAPEPVDELIHRAGGALARAALELLGGGYGRRVVLVAGKGNNGADGRDAAERLRARGARVVEVDAADPPERLPGADLVIDAGFGTGFRGEYEAPLTDAPVLACDIPSGVDGLTGTVGGRVHDAVATVTFAALKPGLVLEPGASHAGAVEVADIGLDVSRARAHLVEAADIGRWLPARDRDSHKWRAASWIVGGSPGMTGAPRLAAEAAMRAGAGYVRLSVPGATDVAPSTEVVTTDLGGSDWAGPVLGDEERFGSLVLGPGLGRDPDAQESARRLVEGSTRPTVVDGDGLRALDGSTPVRRDDSAPVVLTPHDGEFEGLTGSRPDADRFAAARSLAGTTGAIVLLKGPCTVVAAPDGSALAVTEGDARLATAGTGDVLSGVIGAFLARGAAPLHAAAAGAFVHARAGAVSSRHGLVAGDLIDHLPAVLDDLLE